MASAFANHAFATLVIALFVGVLLWIAHVARVGPAPGISSGVALAAWLTIPSSYAREGALGDMVVLALTGVGMLAAIGLGLSRAVVRAIDRSSGAWLVGVQALRLPLALVLWRLAAEGLYEHRVSAFGMSLDVITGALAPPLAWFVYRERALSERWLLAFHGLGLALLAVLLGEVVLVVTSESQVLEASPFLWLGTFLIPVALFAHLASLRQVSRGLRSPSLT